MSIRKIRRLEDWEIQRLPEADTVERRFSDCLEQFTKGRYYVIKCGRGNKGEELPIDATEHIDYGLIRHGKDEEFISFIDVVGRDCAINSYPDYVVRNYKGAFIKNALQYNIPTFIIQEMKRENAPLVNRYIWVNGERVIKYQLKELERKMGEPQWNHPVPITEWHRGLESFIKYIEQLPDILDLYLDYKDVLFNPISGVGFIDE